MGEAKRRKTLRMQEVKRMQQMRSKPLPDGWVKEADYCDVFEEALSINFFSEKNALINRRSSLNEFNAGRLELFESLDKLIVLNACPVGVDDPFYAGIAKAGQMIYDSWEKTPHLSTNPMHDELVWLFIPKGLHRLVDVNWHGIGGWTA